MDLMGFHGVLIEFNGISRDLDGISWDRWRYLVSDSFFFCDDMSQLDFGGQNAFRAYHFGIDMVISGACCLK